MTKKQLGYKLDIDYKIFKKSWGIMMMPLVRKYNSDWDAARIEIKQLWTEWIEKWYERIVTEAVIIATKQEILAALLERIETDFFKKGIIREKKALKILQQKLPQVEWNNDPSNRVEEQGIDIIGECNGEKIGISVKGFPFLDWEEYKAGHIRKLQSQTEYITIIILCIDEKNNKCKSIMIKKGFKNV